MPRVNNLVRVTISVFQDTYDKVSYLHRALNAPNKTDAVSAAVSIAVEVVKELELGSKIYFERPNGTRWKLTVPRNLWREFDGDRRG